MSIAWPVTLVFWHWWILGGGLLLLELLAPGVVFLWMGLAAGLTGVVALLAPALPWELQALIFAVLALLTTFAGRRVWRPASVRSDRPLLNRRAQRSVGSVVTLVTPLHEGRGRVQVGDGGWSAVGADGVSDLPAGTSVRIVAVRDGDMVVAPLDPAGPHSP